MFAAQQSRGESKQRKDNTDDQIGRISRVKLVDEGHEIFPKFPVLRGVHEIHFHPESVPDVFQIHPHDDEDGKNRDYQLSADDEDIVRKEYRVFVTSVYTQVERIVSFIRDNGFFSPAPPRVVINLGAIECKLADFVIPGHEASKTKSGCEQI